ncbi:MAG TPA: DinB family protein [Vicinamibacterales bacterium]|nr:DinB family protein [Vicinamibacterales bacterium]
MYDFVAIPDNAVPRAACALAQPMLETYVSETNKVASVWREFADADLAYRPHPSATPVGGILKHQLLSERRFFAEFLGLSEPPADRVLPPQTTAAAFVERLVELARPRPAWLAPQPEAWWLEARPFFDVTRSRAWIFWRRVLHTAHHRTQLTVYLRTMGRRVPSTYGPTADVTWTSADPTTSVDAAGRT